MRRAKSIPFFFLTLFLIHIAGGTHPSFAAFSTSDLTGTWSGHELYVGEWAGWEYSELTVTTLGNFSLYWWDSEGASNTTPETGTLNISSQGIITHEGRATFHGAVSSDKNIIVITETQETGVYSLMILVKGVPIYNPALPLLLLGD